MPLSSEAAPAPSPRPALQRNRAVLDTSMCDDERQGLLRLNGLTSIHRSEPFWIANGDEDIMTFSASKLVQQQLDQLLASTTTTVQAQTQKTSSPVVLFKTPQDHARFDAQWRHCFQSMLPDHEVTSILETGRSNTHPLRLQLVACPRDTSFSLHVHPAVELDIPLVGDLYERRACQVLLDRTTLQRRPHHHHHRRNDVASLDPPPTPLELARVSQDLSRHVVFEDYGPQGIFTNGRIPQGQALVNHVGSVHQSFTSRINGCLLFVLGPNVHAHFEPGNFRQRQGIELLQGIESLLRMEK